MSSTFENEDGLRLKDRRVAFIGKLGGMTRREAKQLIRQEGGAVADSVDDSVDLIVIGADELPLVDQDQQLDASTRTAAAEGRLEVVTETEMWQKLGFVENELNVRRLYTPAMLAELLDVSVATVRRWHRRKLIVPAREVHKLPYFDFQEIATARRLAQLMAAGASPQSIEKKLARLSEVVPNVTRPLAQLSVLVEGKEILLRQGEGLLEPSGQMRFDFDAFEPEDESTTYTVAINEQVEGDGDVDTSCDVDTSIDVDTSFDVDADRFHEANSPDEIEDLALQFEDQGELDQAIETYRGMLVAFGPKAEICFQLAELLYRTGDVAAACERYYMAVELDEDYVEARANLGCVLAETNQHELAVAAFEGALKYHHDYPDVHFHLARSLDILQRRVEAEKHWKSFLRLAPESPWADEARVRVEKSS